MEDKLKISPGFFLIGALAVLMLPFRWVLGMVLAAMVHEVFHCIAIFLTGGQVLCVSLGPFGARIDASPMSSYKEALCALAGPVGSFSMLLISEQLPEAALCGLIQGMFNLLPVYPLDGGRILHCLLPESVCQGFRVFTLILLTGICLWMITCSLEIGFILLISLWLAYLQRKISCKEAR